MRTSLFLIPLLLCALFCEAQTRIRRGTGLVFDDAAYNAVQRQSPFRGHDFGELPFTVSLKPYCPQPGDQGNLGSCVGWATAYGAYSIQQAIQKSWTDQQQITNAAFSPLFLYNQIKLSDCVGGSRIHEAVEFLQSNGDCAHADFNTSDCYEEPAEPIKQKALNNRIKDYATLFSTADADANFRIFKTKQSLADNKPVVVGMNINEGFSGLSAFNAVWNPNDGTPYAGGHAMVVVGYDDSKGAFEIMNSWGTAWGDKGFFWVNYADFAQAVKYGFQIYLNQPNEQPTTPTNDPLALAGSFRFRYVLPYDNNGNGIQFDDARPFFNDNLGHYELERKDWKLGQLFQVIAQNNRPEEYVYVFSIDNDYKVNVHFPRSVAYNSKFYGFNEAPLVPQNNVEIIIPTPDTGLTITTLGTDYLVTLFANQPIDDFKEVTDMIALSVSLDMPIENGRSISFVRSVGAALIHYLRQQRNALCRFIYRRQHRAAGVARGFGTVNQPFFNLLAACLLPFLTLVATLCVAKCLSCNFIGCCFSTFLSHERNSFRRSHASR